MGRSGTGKRSTNGGDGSGEDVKSWMVGIGASNAVRPTCAPTVVEYWLRDADAVSFGAAAVERGRLEDDGSGGKQALLGWESFMERKRRERGKESETMGVEDNEKAKNARQWLQSVQPHLSFTCHTRDAPLHCKGPWVYIINS